jgi:CRISPR-associated endonuclease/helicase Cas3
MPTIFSHPDKPLQVHLEGVRNNTRRRGLHNFYTEFASIYHDIAKTNQHFQNKLVRDFDGEIGYSNHSYLSAYIALYILMSENKVSEYYMTRYGISDEHFVPLNIMANIITCHHGNLRNIKDLFKPKLMVDKNGNTVEHNEVAAMKAFIESNDTFPFIDFINEHYVPLGDDKFGKGVSEIPFVRVFREDMLENIRTTMGVGMEWRENALEHFQTTQMSFAQLIEADKRDASRNGEYRLDGLPVYNAIFQNNLSMFMGNLSAKADKSELNSIRTRIGTDAVNELKRRLVSDPENRMFTLTSPTGSGKTFMMLQLASVIQQAKGDYGIILSLPFTSIIDQTSAICGNDLLLDVLNYTSVSNSSPMMDRLQELSESNPEAVETLKRMVDYRFSEDSFDHPFVITTFVQFFQTLISNRNSTLLKLPNFTKRIFLIDEFQSMPVNQYTFFYSVLQEFCVKNDSYAIFSTATMPHIELNGKATNGGVQVSKVFKSFERPIELLPDHSYFNAPVFNRYTVQYLGNATIGGCENSVGLLRALSLESQSVLVVLNTVKDTLKVFNGIADGNTSLGFNIDRRNLYLLNKKITPKNRLRIINEVKSKVDRGVRVILVSTQLIEAGVDLDFPVVYRDIAPLPSVIQTAGRCNRNGRIGMGVVKIFKLREEETQYKVYRAEYVYHPYDLKFSERVFSEKTRTESELFGKQVGYFKTFAKYKEIGRISDKENLVDFIHNGEFEKLGAYRMVSTEDEVSYYVGDDVLWAEFSSTVLNRPIFNGDYSILKAHRIKVENLRKKITQHCVVVKNNKQMPAFSEEIMDVRKLAAHSAYHEHTGLMV